MEDQRFDFGDLLSQIGLLDELLEVDNDQQQPTQVPAAGHAGDVNRDLRDILGDEFMNNLGDDSQSNCEAPQAEPGAAADGSDAMPSDGFANSFDSDGVLPPSEEELKKSAISSGTSCSMLVDRLNKNNAGMDDTRAGAQVCASMVGAVDLLFTDKARAKEWKDRIGSVPEGWEEMTRKIGFSKCCKRLTTALDTLQGSDLEIEMLSISKVLSKIFRMSSSFVGAGMLYQATKAFVYEEEQAKGNTQRTVLLVRALNTIGLDDIKVFWKEVCLSGTVPVKFAPRSGESSDGPVIEMMGAENSCEFAWTMFLTGWIKFLSKGQEQDIDTAQWRLKYWATREKHHVLWQMVNSDGSLEDVELWFPREDGAVAEMVRGEKLINGREKLAPTLFERCRQAMVCMHPKFMEKYSQVVAQKALDLDAEVFEQKDGVPIVKDFEEMRDLMRLTQRVWKADPVQQGKVPKSSTRAGKKAGGTDGGNGGKAQPSKPCRVCKSTTHATKDCPNRPGTSCRQWCKTGACSFGDECVHEHKVAEKGPKTQQQQQQKPPIQLPVPRPAVGAAGAPAWLQPPASTTTSMPIVGAEVPWTPGKVHEKTCRGDSCKKPFKEKEDDWLGRKLPNGEQLSMPVWCPECREKRRAMHTMCIELECSECDQDDREDDVPAERCGVPIGEADLVMVITEEEDELSGLDEFLVGLQAAQQHISDVGARGEAEADEQVAAFRWSQVPEVDDGVSASAECNSHLAEIKASADAWWKRFMDGEQLGRLEPDEATRMISELKISEEGEVESTVDEGDDKCATEACTAYATTRTVSAAFLQAAAIVRGKVDMFSGTPSEVSAEVRKEVVTEVMWMVHRQLRQWHCEAGEVALIDNKALVVDWLAVMGRGPTFGQWVRQRVGELDMARSGSETAVMAGSTVVEENRREALEVAVKWLRCNAAEEVLFARHGDPGWQLFDELLDWDLMGRAKEGQVVPVVGALGAQLQGMVKGGRKGSQVWKEVQLMLSSEEVWVFRECLLGEADMQSCGMMLSMMGTSVEMQRALRVSAIRRGVGIVALAKVAEQVAAISVLDSRMWRWTHYNDKQRMGLVSTLLQGSVVTMRLWARVLAQAQEVTAVVVDNSPVLAEVNWAGVVRSGCRGAAYPDVDIQVGVRVDDMFEIKICACDEEGMGGSEDCEGAPRDEEGVRKEQSEVPMPEVHHEDRLIIYDESDSDGGGTESTDSGDETSIAFARRQRTKFGVDDHIDASNITEGKRKRTATVVYNIGSHSGGEECELNDVDEEESDSTMRSNSDSGTTTSDEARVCDVVRRRQGGSPVWEDRSQGERMNIEELESSATDTSEMSVSEWLDAEIASGSGSKAGGSVNRGGEYGTGMEVCERDETVSRWLEDAQAVIRTADSVWQAAGREEAGEDSYGLGCCCGGKWWYPSCGW